MMPQTLMMPLLGILAVGMVATIPGETDMTDTDDRAVTMDHTVEAGTIAVVVIGHARTAMTVDYEIELTGRSRSRHRGKTTLPDGKPTILSRLAVSTGDEWCAQLSVRQSDGTRYTQSAGPACGDGGNEDFWE